MPKIPVGRYRLARKQVKMAQWNQSTAARQTNARSKAIFLARAEKQLQAARDFKSGARRISSAYRERFIQSSWI